MEIKFSPGFRKSYHKLPLKFRNAFNKRLKLFKQDPHYPILRDHQLSGKLKGHRAFSITGDIRVVYYIYEDIAYFMDIGTHNQVYGE